MSPPSFQVPERRATVDTALVVRQRHMAGEVLELSHANQMTPGTTKGMPLKPKGTPREPQGNATSALQANAMGREPPSLETM